MRRTVWRVAQWAAGIAIVVIAARQLLAGWSDVAARPLVWQVRPALLVVSAASIWLMYAVLIQAWRVMLAGWGDRLGAREAARIWTVSSLGKYIPGKVWALAGMAVMAQRAGVRPWAATASAVMLQALAIGTGAAVVGVSGSAALRAEYPWVGIVLPLLVVGSAAGMALLLWPAFVRRLFALARIELPGAASPGVAPVLYGVAANILAWCGYGVAFWLLGRGLLELPGLSVGRAIAAFAASYIAGLLFLPAPGGIGVRESVVILMLTGAVGPASASALAVASRVLLTLTEFGAAAPFLLSPRERMRAES
jgi:hypothetical protein